MYQTEQFQHVILSRGKKNRTWKSQRQPYINRFCSFPHSPNDMYNFFKTTKLEVISTYVSLEYVEGLLHNLIVVVLFDALVQCSGDGSFQIVPLDVASDADTELSCDNDEQKHGELKDGDEDVERMDAYAQFNLALIRPCKSALSQRSANNFK